MIKEINDIFKKSPFKIILRTNDKNLWNKSLDEIDYVPVFYTNESLDFQQEILNSSGVKSLDISFVFTLQNKILANWPLSINIEGDKQLIKTFSLPVLCPLFSNSINRDLKKKLFKETVRIINEINTICNDELEFRHSFLNSLKLNYWYIKSLKFVKKNNIEYELFLKINKKFDEISKNFRKGTKSSIKQSESLWIIEIILKKNDKTWKEFRNLHFLASGRITRSEKSWKIQYENLINGSSFLISLRNKDGKMIGGGFFSCSRDECEYSTAAYDRKLFDKPIGHVVQKIAIKEMIKRKIKWYRIGIKALESNQIKPTKKEYSISLFKEGFSSDIFPIYKTNYFFGGNQ